MLLYDLRSDKPLLVKDHQYGLPIKSVHFQNSLDLVLSADSRIVKMWNKDSVRTFCYNCSLFPLPVSSAASLSMCFSGFCGSLRRGCWVASRSVTIGQGMSVFGHSWHEHPDLCALVHEEGLSSGPWHIFFWACVRWKKITVKQICLWKAFRSCPHHLAFGLSLLPVRMAVCCNAHWAQRTAWILVFLHGIQGWIRMAQQTLWPAHPETFQLSNYPSRFWGLLTFVHSRVSVCPRFISCPHLKQAGSRNSKYL